jgi:hypothetical protein
MSPRDEDDSDSVNIEKVRKSEFLHSSAPQHAKKGNPQRRRALPMQREAQHLILRQHAEILISF